MNLDMISQSLRASLEALRAGLLQQPWLGFAHAWLADADVSNLWAILIVAIALIVLGLVIIWPVKRDRPHDRNR
jgi:hypothetical protein